MRAFYFRKKKEELFGSYLDALQSTDDPGVLNNKQIIQFLIFGGHYFSETPHVEVNKKFTHQEFTLSPTEGFVPETTSCSLTRMDIKDPIHQFLHFFEQRKDFLTKYKISIDLTGGIDSRLIAAVLKHFEIPFDAAYSLGSGTHSEAKLVKQVASCLDCKLDIINPPDITGASHVQALFQIGDGCTDIIKLNSLYSTQKWRAENNYNLVITGAGGELYKDFWWLQDFPWYTKKKANISKLLKYRMYPEVLQTDWVSKEFRYEKCIQDLLLELNHSVRATNTETYDVIYLDVRIKEQVSALTKAASNYIHAYSPLLENELLQTGFNLPRSKRFFNRFHRAVISRLNPKLAALPTSDGGMTVSNSPLCITSDFLKYINSKSQKAIHKVVKARRAGTPDSHKTVDPPNEFLMEQISRAIQTLKKNGILTKSAPSEVLAYSPALWGRILTIAMLISYKKNSHN